jgi:hypothetical protein
MKKGILIVGTPRSGTGYVSQMLRNSGIQVGHECLMRDGMSSWLCAVNDPHTVFGPSRDQVFQEFDDVEVYHQVRFPIQSIASFKTETKLACDYVKRHIKVGDYYKDIKEGMRFWLLWNEISEKTSQKSYCLEKAHHFFDVPPIKDNSYNSRPHEQVTAQMLFEADRYMFVDCIQMYNDIYRRNERR